MVIDLNKKKPCVGCGGESKVFDKNGIVV